VDEQAEIVKWLMFFDLLNEKAILVMKKACGLCNMFCLALYIFSVGLSVISLRSN
jgi:hypothetical protein